MITPKELDAINTASDEYAHRAIEYKTPFLCHKNDFIQGVTSDTAKEYWFDKFNILLKEKLVELDPSLIDEEYTNPFLYRDIEEWYKELNK